MSRADNAPAIGLTTIPRAVLSVAHGVVSTVERAMVGDARVRTSRGNAWEALCADRDRAARRAELRRVAAELAAAQRPAAASSGGATSSGQVTVGSSPRSSASHASLVATGPSSRG